MANEERKGWFSSGVQPAGLLVSAWFLLRFLVWLHLALVGQLAEGRTARLLPGEFQQPDEEVPYAYQPPGREGMPFMGSRRGLEYGGNRLSVVYSPIRRSFHTVGTKELVGAGDLWRDGAYVMRLVLYLFGVLAGGVIYMLPKWLSKGGVGFSLMPGLTRDDPLNPR